MNRDLFEPEIRRKSVELIRDSYEMAGRMVNVDLEAVNRSRPSRLRYGSQSELVREFVERANATMEFATSIGLLTADEAKDLLRGIGQEHPALQDWLTM